MEHFSFLLLLLLSWPERAVYGENQAILKVSTSIAHDQYSNFKSVITTGQPRKKRQDMTVETLWELWTKQRMSGITNHLHREAEGIAVLISSKNQRSRLEFAKIRDTKLLAPRFTSSTKCSGEKRICSWSRFEAHKSSSMVEAVSWHGLAWLLQERAHSSL